MGTPNVIRELENRFAPARRVPSSARWLVATGALASVAVFAVTAALLEDRPTAVDLDVESSVEERPDHRLMLLPMKALAVASSARGSFFLLLAVGLFFAFRRNDWHPGLLVGAAFIGVAASTAVLKALFDRPTPVDWAAGDLSGESFPSGHMAQAVAVWGIIAIIVAMDRPRRTGRLLATGAVLMIAGAAASRLVLGAHWLTDVIAGTALGVFWLALAAALAFWIRPSEPAGDTEPGRRSA
ncbi:MAG: phosphatase PAP2 family protein [Actinomycetota bacterium]